MQKIVVQCKYGGEQRANYNWGSLFHGYLLKALPPDVAETLHYSRLRPFSQFVLPQPGQALSWVIGAWDMGIAEHIGQAVLPLTQIELQQKDLTLEVTGIQKTLQSEQEFFSRYFSAGVPCRRYGLEFLTPCTHRRDGQYVLFPGPDLIVNSISRRYSAHTRDLSIDDPQAMEQIAQHMRIVRYSLRTAVYYLETTKITGYMGRITLVIGGPEQLARLAGALLSFAGYCGIGIKTALGMGAVNVKQIV